MMTMKIERTMLSRRMKRRRMDELINNLSQGATTAVPTAHLPEIYIVIFIIKKIVVMIIKSTVIMIEIIVIMTISTMIIMTLTIGLVPAASKLRLCVASTQ